MWPDAENLQGRLVFAGGEGGEGGRQGVDGDDGGTASMRGRSECS